MFIYSLSIRIPHVKNTPFRLPVTDIWTVGKEDIPCLDDSSSNYSSAAKTLVSDAMEFSQCCSTSRDFRELRLRV